MMIRPLRYLPVVLSFFLLFASPKAAQEVQPLFDHTAESASPFPSDLFTVADPAQNTGRRVNLPKPDCAQQPNDCQDVDVLNTLDGFNVQPRLSIPFNGEIDPGSVTRETVFLVRLPCSHGIHDKRRRCGDTPTPEKVGVNQIVWDAPTRTLHVESDALLEQHTRYALIVTRGVRTQRGEPIAAAPRFRSFHHSIPFSYKVALLHAVQAARKLGVRERQIAVATVFTTQSVTAVLEKIRDQIKATTPAAADFAIAADGSRAVFALAGVSGIQLRAQTGTAPLFAPAVNLTLTELRSVPGVVGQIAFGRFTAADYQVHPGDVIPAVGTRTGSPAITGTHAIYFNLVLPSGTQPPGGWPVVIAGHGGGGNKEGWLGVAGTLAAALAQRGIATVAINGVGHGFGPLGSLTVNQSTGPQLTFPSGGRGIDQNGDGIIGPREGIAAAAPRTLIDDADGFRQTVADLMQLVRQIEVGVDVDDDSLPDLDRSRIYYVAQSLGGVYGTAFVAVEPAVKAAVLNATGGPRTFRTLTTRGDRAVIAASLAARTPSLINAPGVTHLDEVAVPLVPLFHENLPLRDGEPLDVRLADGTSHIVRSPVMNSVPDALGIQQYLDRTEWAMQSASPVAYAPYLRKAPLDGVGSKHVIIQFAKGDRTMPNPATTAMLRAGDLADRATLYRHDLAFAENPALPIDPHGFMPLVAAFGAIARGAQEQIVMFFDSDGELTIYPSQGLFFEVPIAGPLPETLNFIR